MSTEVDLDVLDPIKPRVSPDWMRYALSAATSRAPSVGRSIRPLSTKTARAYRGPPRLPDRHHEHRTPSQRRLRDAMLVRERPCAHQLGPLSCAHPHARELASSWSPGGRAASSCNGYKATALAFQTDGAAPVLAGGCVTESCGSTKALRPGPRSSASVFKCDEDHNVLGFDY
jgi:hypothetical protein